jgi:hypothetical protein
MQDTNFNKNWQHIGKFLIIMDLLKYPKFCWSLFTSAFSKLQADTLKKKQFINQHKENIFEDSCILLSISNITAFVTKWNEAWAWSAGHSV